MADKLDHKGLGGRRACRRKIIDNLLFELGTDNGGRDTTLNITS